MKKIYILSVLLLLATSYYSCKPNDPAPPKEPETFLVWQEGWDYCFFKTGTWWVYQDSISGAYDTMRVYEDDKGLDSVKDNNGRLENVYEWFDVRVYSTYSKYNYYYQVHRSFSNQLRRIKVKTGEYVGETIYFIYPPTIGKRLGYSPDIAEVVDKMDSVFVNSKLYFNTIKISHTSDETEGKKPTNYYLAKNIGYYRKEVGTTEVWKLIDYNIVQS